MTATSFYQSGLLLCFLCLHGAALLAQQPADTTLIIRPDSLARVAVGDTLATTDTIQPARRPNPVKRFWTKGYPNPRKAAFMSLALPGLGQAYNRSWWKIPLVWGTLGGLTWLEFQNIAVYREARDNYKALVDGDPNTVVEPDYIGADRTSLKRFRDANRKALEQSSLILGFAYLFNAGDAFVDAHLKNFDISDDLSFRVKPAAIPAPGATPALGCALVFQF